MKGIPYHVWMMLAVAAIILTIVIVGVHGRLVWRKRLRALGPHGVHRMRKLELAGLIRAGNTRAAVEYARIHDLELPTDELLALGQRQLGEVVRGSCVNFHTLNTAVATYKLAGVAPPQDVVPIILKGIRNSSEYVLSAATTAYNVAKSLAIFPQDQLSLAGRELMERGCTEGAALLGWIGETPTADLYRRCADAIVANAGDEDTARVMYVRAVEAESEQ